MLVLSDGLPNTTIYSLDRHFPSATKVSRLCSPFVSRSGYLSPDSLLAWPFDRSYSILDRPPSYALPRSRRVLEWSCGNRFLRNRSWRETGVRSRLRELGAPQRVGGHRRVSGHHEVYVNQFTDTRPANDRQCPRQSTSLLPPLHRILDAESNQPNSSPHQGPQRVRYCNKRSAAFGCRVGGFGSRFGQKDERGRVLLGHLGKWG